MSLDFPCFSSPGILFSISGNEVTFNLQGGNVVNFDISKSGPQGPQGIQGVPGQAGGPAQTLAYTDEGEIDIAATSGLTYIIVNSTEISSTPKLPNPPAQNQSVIIIDGNYGAGDFPITVDGNGNMINSTNGAAGTYTFASPGGCLKLVWNLIAWSQF